MAAILRGAPQVLDISSGVATISLFDSPDPNAQVTFVFSGGDDACELHAALALDGGSLPIEDTSSGNTFLSGPFALAGAPRYVDAGAGTATTITVQVVQIAGE